MKKNFLSIDFYVKLNINIEILTEITVRFQYIEYIKNPNNHKNIEYSSENVSTENLSNKLKNKENYFEIETYHIIMKYICNVETTDFSNCHKNEKFKFISESVNSNVFSRFFSQINTEKIHFLSILDFEGDFEDDMNQFNYNLWNYVDLYGFPDFIKLISEDQKQSFIIGEKKSKATDNYLNFYESENIYDKILKQLENDSENSSLNNSKFTYDPENMWYTKYYNDYTSLIHYLINYEGFQTLFNEHILTKNKNLTIIFI